MIKKFKEVIPATPAEVVGLFLLLACFLLVFLVSHYSTDLNYPFPHWDKVLHTTAGISLALIFYPHIKGRQLVFLVFLLGLAFECVEICISPPAMYGGLHPYLIDTIGDLIVDALGAWIVVLGYQRYGK